MTIQTSWEEEIAKRTITQTVGNNTYNLVYNLVSAAA